MTESKSYCFVFPGQGSQFVGMGFELAGRFSDFADIYKDCLQRADQQLGFKLSEIMEKGPESELKKTEITQPALLTTSTAMELWLKKNAIQPRLALGHSLGEYSALVCVGAMDFETALQLVSKRAHFMRDAVPHGKGGMAALVGSSEEEARALCASLENPNLVLEPSVFNSTGQVVVSGHTEALEEAEKKASQFGVRKFVRLEVGGPFHCSLLRSAGDQLAKELEKMELKSPKLPVIFNVDAKAHQDPEIIKKKLIEQVYRPVLWAESIRAAGDEGCEDFIEVGSGRVLSALIRKILPEARCTSLDHLQKLEILAA